MAKRKMTPLALVLTLVDGLSSDEIATLADFLRGKEQSRPKSSNAPSAGKRSPRSKSGEESKVNTEGVTGNATTASIGKCAVPNCGLGQDEYIHSPANPDYHIFRAAIKTKGAGV